MFENLQILKDFIYEIEMDGEKYFFMSGYKLYHDKKKLDLFIENFNY